MSFQSELRTNNNFKTKISKYITRHATGVRGLRFKYKHGVIVNCLGYGSCRVMTVRFRGNSGFRASFQLFLGVAKFFLYFSMPTGLLKNWKKQHFTCSNLTLFIVPFFLSFFPPFFLFFTFFPFFFFFVLGGGRPQPPSNDAPGFDCKLVDIRKVTKTISPFEHPIILL